MGGLSAISTGLWDMQESGDGLKGGKGIYKDSPDHHNPDGFESSDGLALPEEELPLPALARTKSRKALRIDHFRDHPEVTSQKSTGSTQTRARHGWEHGHGSGRRLGSLEESDDLSVVQECLVGAFLLLLMCMVYLFTRRVTAPKAFNRIVRKKAPTFVHKLH